MVPNPKSFSSTNLTNLMRQREDPDAQHLRKQVLLPQQLQQPVNLQLQSLDQNNNRLSPPPSANIRFTPPPLLKKQTSRNQSPLPATQSAIQLNLASSSCKYSTQQLARLGSQELLAVRRAHSDSGAKTVPQSKIYNFKILVVGEMASGKSSYIRKLSQTKRPPMQPANYYKATIGIEFRSKLIEWDLNTLVNLELWDIGGQENCVQMSNVFFRDAFGAILMFDVSNRSSFDAILKWKQSLDASVRLNDNSSIPCVLLANKCDLDSAGSWLMPEKLEQFCKENNILTFFYTSVKKNVNLEVVCHCLITEILKRYQKQEYQMLKPEKKAKKKYNCANCSLM